MYVYRYMTDKEQIEQIIRDLYQALGFTVEIKVREALGDGDSVERTFFIQTEDAQYLIGHHGSNLRSLEHLAHVIAHGRGIPGRFEIDINDYRAGKKRMFEHIAKEAATEAARSKKPVILRPMNAAERRMVHVALHDDIRVSTDSIGEGDDRKIVVKPESVLDTL